MDVSVIVSCYNHQDYILSSLQSILDNRVSNMEVIVCDDGSEDCSPAIIKKWLKENSQLFERTLFIEHKKNYNITTTLNELVSECRGHIISPLASDDYYLKDGIKTRRDAMRRNPQWLGAFSDGVAISVNDEILSESILHLSSINPKTLNPINIRQTVIEKWQEPMNLQFWRRDAFRAFGGGFEFDESLSVEDIDFALWSISQNAFGFINQKTYAYRYRSIPQTWPNDSRATARKKLSDFAVVYAKYANLFSPTESRFLLNSSYYMFGRMIDNQAIAQKYYNITRKGIINPTFLSIFMFFEYLHDFLKRRKQDILWWAKYLKDYIFRNPGH